MEENLNNILTLFQAVSLADIDSVALLKRTDTKFILPGEMLPQILENITSEYKILEINGQRLMEYKSLYFDTNDLKFYIDHHNGKLKRTKIRIRKYVSSDLHFLEIKMKDGKGNTNKFRRKISGFQENLDDSYLQFIEDVTGHRYELKPNLWNSFRRMTLLNIERKERVTIDLNLGYSFNNLAASVENLAIIELKQLRYDRTSPIAKALKEQGILPYGFSKYCIGIAQLCEGVKQNAFKPKLLKINKLTA